ncbi:hypothetical protein [Anaerotignum sp. MB30-C6]|uniref:hypothetical protein n=1 Tax=Anaerotignum sp. MB30-C6 TaxID=3070814 RepID=UPI0027DB7AC1|nr:hypothetical protein [Anaerotignum sp. MB30-C6]WMI81573.1 hypothetical protein RBQ60_02220 [Anaerotignum sp. MB30-C6]
MDSEAVKEVERLIDLKENRKLRKKRKRRKAIFIKLWKGMLTGIVGAVAMFVIVLLSLMAPEVTLRAYNGCAILIVIRVFGTWLDKPRRKK